MKVKVWKWKCGSESVKVKVWKWKYESVKVEVWKWKCEIVEVKLWKWKCESESVKGENIVRKGKSWFHGSLLLWFIWFSSLFIAENFLFIAQNDAENTTNKPTP